MFLKWKERLNDMPQLSVFDNWPSIDVTMIDKPKRKTFIRNQRIVAYILSGQTIRHASLEFGISSSFISQLLSRCLAGDSKDEPALTTALIPHVRLAKGKRAKHLSSVSEPAGCRGSFNYMLENVPNLDEHLNKIIFNYQKNRNYSQNIKPKYFHQEFLRFLNDIGWPKSQYPFDQQHLGYESCRQFLHRKLAELDMPIQKTTRIISSTKTTSTPYQEIQIDSQLLDLTTSITISVNGHETKHRLTRLTLFLATDVATNCHLGYQLCLTKSPNQSDLLSLLEKIHLKWEPTNLNTPGLHYSPGACFPSALSETARNISIGIIRLDNALCHLAHSVRSYICNQMSATINYGLPAQPKSRNYIEYAFARLNNHIHRFPSTTGSNIYSAIKESKKNIKMPPLISLEVLDEILSVMITEHNVTPQEPLGGLTPLSVMQASLSGNYVPVIFSNITNRLNPFTKQEKVKVKWYSKEKRHPHVNFTGLRYRGVGINTVELIGKSIIIEYDMRDVRKLHAYTTNGKPLGMLMAPKSWQRYPHSLYLRKKIQREIKKELKLGKDPLAGYFNYLLENKDLPTKSTELVRVYKEFSRGESSIQTKSKNIDPSPNNSDSKPLPNSLIPSWNSKIFEKKHDNL